MTQANKLAVMSGRNWGVNPKLTRLWYKTVAERRICYAASTWAENLNNKKIAQLSTIQRLFTLKITRAYRTTPSSALLILSGLLPLHLTVKKEAIITNVTRLGRNDKFGSTHFNTTDYDTQMSQWTEPPWSKPSTTLKNILHSNHGPFPNYLNRFCITENDPCLCGEPGTPDHYLFSCPLTDLNHEEEPPPALYHEWAIQAAKCKKTKR
ncbi:RNase H domain-containing protein [Caerostris extrusa]|uniref:RNase H domain-containing protein n=1 Tax=Caerostris extrusa TaxID=172846 RepID=A0AAV4NLF4_CAEEX|nr:RNase H domain-containing protein [Caerostris extrusa]